MLGLIVLSVAEGAKEPSRVVPASEVLAKIQKDQPVEYDHVTITGDFDLSKLDLQSRYVPWTGTFRVISTRTEIEGRSEDKK
jgi:cytochrome oxidase assembly protein ShyY1